MDTILTKNDLYKIMYHADRIITTYRYEGYWYDDTLEHPNTMEQTKEYHHATFEEFRLKMQTSLLNFSMLDKLCDLSLFDLSEIELKEVKELIAKELPFLRRYYRASLAENHIALSEDFTDDYLDEILAAEWRSIALLYRVQQDHRIVRKKGHVPGYPIYDLNDKVVFRYNGDSKTGIVSGVDGHGEFGQDEEPAYDILVAEDLGDSEDAKQSGHLYKHIRESEITKWIEP